MAARLGAVEAAQLEPVHDQVGHVLEVLAVVIGEFRPRLGVENAQCADFLARGRGQRYACVEANLRRLLNQRVGGEPLVLARVGDEKEPVALDSIGAKASLAADAGRLHAEPRLEEQTLLADERQGGHRCAVHAGRKLDQPVEIDVGRCVQYGVFVERPQAGILVWRCRKLVIAADEHQGLTGCPDAKSATFIENEGKSINCRNVS